MTDSKWVVVSEAPYDKVLLFCSWDVSCGAHFIGKKVLAKLGRFSKKILTTYEDQDGALRNPYTNIMPTHYMELQIKPKKELK